LGYLEDLESLIGVYGNSVANGISAKGGITGTSDQIIDSDGDTASHAFYFVSSRTGMVDLGTNGGTLAEGNATQNGDSGGRLHRGRRCGLHRVLLDQRQGHGQPEYAGWRWRFGRLQQLCVWMNTKGLAVGNSDSPDGTTHAVAWTLKTGAIKDLKTLGGSYAQAMAVNDSNMAVGFSTLVGDAQTDAFVW
jgi:uncharacterized membrane protein